MLTETAALVDARTQRQRSCSISNGEARPRTDVTIGQYDYGGLFLRMPWREGMRGEVVNAARQRNERAEGQRAMWIDVGMQVEGRNDLAHIAIFDHPDNAGYPQAWRVDGQLGVGCRAVARRRLDDRARADGGRPPPVRRLHGHAQRRRDDQRVGGVQRQHGIIRRCRAVGDRAAGRPRSESS